jgi:hypothetical protein
MNQNMDTLFYGIGVFIQNVVQYFNSTTYFNGTYDRLYHEDFNGTVYDDFYGANLVDCLGDDSNV